MVLNCDGLLLHSDLNSRINMNLCRSFQIWVDMVLNYLQIGAFILISMIGYITLIRADWVNLNNLFETKMD